MDYGLEESFIPYFRSDYKTNSNNECLFIQIQNHSTATYSYIFEDYIWDKLIYERRKNNYKNHQIKCLIKPTRGLLDDYFPMGKNEALPELWRNKKTTELYFKINPVIPKQLYWLNI